MKRNLLWMLLIAGITISALGAYLLHKGDYFVRNNQILENEFGETSKASEKPEAGQIREAYEWRALAWKDENGYIPPNGWSEAIRQRDQYLQRQTQQTGKQVTAEAAARLNWVSRGPQNVGGRTRSLVFHPNGATIYAGSVSGGVWKSTDGGTNWFAMNGNLQNYAIGSMAMHPSNPDILYVGTGEGFEYTRSLRGDGIFKTTDGGMTWTVLSGTTGWESVNRIAIDPNDPDKILVAASGGIMRTVNGGNNWSLVRAGDKSLHVAFHPTDSMKAIGEIREVINGNISHRAVYSTDGGEEWQDASRDGTEFKLTGLAYLNGSKRIELAYSRSNPNIVYALHPEGIARSTDGGASFTTVNSTSLGGVSVYFNALWVSPTNPNLIVAGGLQLHRSTDGGATFTQITAGNILDENPVKPHTDQHCVVPHPGYDGSSNKIVYVCNDGGVYRTDDITTASQTNGWLRKYVTYQTTQYYGVAGNAANNLIYGGTQDNGSLRLRSTNLTTADLPAGGDGGFAAIDPTNPGYCYGELPNLLIHRFFDCREPINQFSQQFTITSGNSSSDALTDAGVPNKSNFISPFILDPNVPTRMLAGGRSLWRTNNARGFLPSWSEIRSPGTDITDNISAIAVAQGDSDVIWVAQNNGKIYKTDDGTAMIPNWTPVDDNGGTNPLPDRFPTRILIDKDNSNVVYVAFGGFEVDNLWKTTDGGSTWTDITGAGLPPAPIRGIARHPTISSKLYIGTEIGVFTTDNGGTTWNAVLDGPANVAVDEVVFMSNSTKLLAATHGRGIWMTDVDDASIIDHALFDFDADGRTDFSVFRPSDGNWYLERSREGFLGVQFNNAQATDKPVARDYDGDGKADIALWRPSNGTWYRLNSSNSTYVAVAFGQQGDIPVPADYDDDGKTDEAVFRPSANAWYLNQSTAGFAGVSFGQSGDLPSATDFDGDDKVDFAVFRPSNGTWYLLQSTNGFAGFQFGQNGDIPVPADYDGDGKADIAVVRQSGGYSNWYVLGSSQGFYGVQFGADSDILVPGDYDGDMKTDIAVWRPTTGVWHLLQSTNGYRAFTFGGNGDVPAPAIP